MVKELKKEIQKIDYLHYPLAFHDLFKYFSCHDYIEFAFVVVNNVLKLVSFKDVIPFLLNCNNGNRVCDATVPDYMLKEPVALDLNDNETKIIEQLQKIIDLEYPAIVLQNKRVLGQIPFKRLILLLKNLEIKEAIFSNPLTGLPGNYQIQKQYFLMKEPFCIAYFDLNNFKPFNDKYGFAKGDEVIKFCGKFLSDNFADGFVGHIGGDDFVIMGNFTKEYLSEKIELFNKEVIAFHNEKDILQGYMTSLDRYGKIVNFPLLSASLSVLLIHQKKSYEEISKELARLKSFAKNKGINQDIPLEFAEIS